MDRRDMDLGTPRPFGRVLLSADEVRDVTDAIAARDELVRMSESIPVLRVLCVECGEYMQQPKAELNLTLDERTTIVPEVIADHMQIDVFPCETCVETRTQGDSNR